MHYGHRRVTPDFRMAGADVSLTGSQPLKQSTGFDRNGNQIDTTWLWVF